VKNDPSQIDQVVVSLFVNARDSISGNGTITIETHQFTQSRYNVATGAME
jgi:signal transduction histidine kinase